MLTNSFLKTRNFSAVEKQNKTVGPGDYYKEIEWIDRQGIVGRKTKYDQNRHKNMMKVKKTAASIPTKKIKNQRFTGVGSDKPGPDSYQPSLKATKRNSNYASFSKFKVKGKGRCGLIYLDLSRNNPEVGPGKYNTMLNFKKNFHVSGGSSVFLSKVNRMQFGEKKKSRAGRELNELSYEGQNEIFSSFPKKVEGNSRRLTL